jgi:hypothetical protein
MAPANCSIQGLSTVCHDESKGVAREAALPAQPLLDTRVTGEATREDAMKTRQRYLGVAPLAPMATTAGCIYRSKTETVVPSSSPPAAVIVTPPAQRTVTYPEGRYELRGDGTAASPYFWVWLSARTQPGTIAPPPPLPR